MTKQVIINMTDKYPFGECAEGDDQSVKVLVRRQIGWGQEARLLSERVLFFRRLNQTCIVQLDSVIEEQECLQLLYEYVPIRMQTWISNINQKFVESFCRQLIQLGDYLSKCFINVSLIIQNVGMDQNYRPKYFLDLNFEIDETLNKNVLKQNYHKQILALFRPYVQSKIIQRPYKFKEPFEGKSETSPSRHLALKNSKPDNYSTSSTYRLKQKAVALQKSRKNESISVMSSNWDMMPSQKNRKQSILSSVSNVKINRLGKRMDDIRYKLRNIYSPEHLHIRHEERSIEKNPNSIAFNWDSTERIYANSIGSNQESIQPKTFCKNILKDLQQDESIFQKFQKNLAMQLGNGAPLKKNESLKAKEYEQMKKSDDEYFKDFFQVLDDKPKQQLALQQPVRVQEQSHRLAAIQAEHIEVSRNHPRSPPVANEEERMRMEKHMADKPGIVELQNRVKSAINKSKKLINKFKGDR